MDTVKIDRGTTKMVAHRGVSGLELENTCAAFVAAGNRSYFGIETDIHKTADGKYIVIHDDKTDRVSNEQSVAEVVSICSKQYGLENMLFISFSFQNMLHVKEAAPEAHAQYLMSAKVDLANRPGLVEKLVANNIGVDVEHTILTKELIAHLHKNGLEVNCRTVGDPVRAEELVAWGVDYITTNILE